MSGRYDFREAEPRLQRRWAELGIYQFDPAEAGPIFSVDTPPPTISGQIHIGHVFSYTQADIAIRYRRMRGESIFYPFGFDDNGLPTERFTEARRGITARAVGRAAFIQACLELSAEVEEQFERFWKRLGLSVDWRLRYSTIDARSRRIAQRSFLDLYERGLLERREAPTIWCPHCRTAVAQADVEDREGLPTSFVTVAFPTADGRAVRIATTRPELLPACVAVFVHPDDERQAALAGATAYSPLFGVPVPVLANPETQREKGTGAVMCCTFGGISDIRWWYTYGLPLRLAIAPDGTMGDRAGPYAGLGIAEARARIIEHLHERGLILERRDTTHTVGVHERCGTPVEFLVAGQWFISLLPHKERFLEAGRRIAWYPPYMHARYESWVRGLHWDWAISRQRYYGVPIPVWYCGGCGTVIPAAREKLPVDPLHEAPGEACPSCGGTALRPDTDVLDTWATSSLTPRICATLAADLGLGEEAFLARCYPMSLRPNAHDIIRTWDFYSIVQSLFHRDEIPWRGVMIAGHAQDPEGRKISKSRLREAADPTATLETFSADAVRYWTAGVRTGSDTALSEEVFRQGGRLVTKLWNAARFTLLHGQAEAGGADDGDAAPEPADLWLLGRLGRAVARATSALEEYELAAARAAVERFFWSDLCDTYLELIKFRLTGGPQGAERVPPQARRAAVQTMRRAMLAVLKLFAPFLPHVTEEIYLQGFAAAEGTPSIHRARWPDAASFPQDERAERAGEALLGAIEEVRRWKAERNLSVGAPVTRLRIGCPADQRPLLAAMALDLRSITRARAVEVYAAGDGALLVEVEG